MTRTLTCDRCAKPSSEWEDGAGYGFGQDHSQYEGVFCSSWCLGEWLAYAPHALVWNLDVEESQ